MVAGMSARAPLAHSVRSDRPKGAHAMRAPYWLRSHMSKTRHELTFLSAAKLAVEEKDGARQLPKSLLVFPWGTQDTNQGKHICNGHTLSVLHSNQQLYKMPRIALDFQHNTVPGTPAYKEPAKVACFGTPRVVEGEGIMLDIDEATWTPEGREHVLNGHYPELSIAPKRNAKGEITFLHSVALCRAGEVKGLSSLSISVNLDPNNAIMDLTNLDPNTVRATANVFLKAAGLACIPDDAQPAAVLSALTGGVEKITTLAAAKPDATLAAGAVKPEDITALHARLDRQERRALVDKATAAGKVVPLADADIDKMEITTLSAMIEKLPVTVPLQQRSGDVTALAARAGADGQMTDADRVVCKNLGISEDAWKKANAA